LTDLKTEHHVSLLIVNAIGHSRFSSSVC